MSYRRILTVNFLSSRSIISKWSRRDGVRQTPSMSLWFQDSPESDSVTKNPFTCIQFNRSSSFSSSGFNCSFFIDCESQYHYSSYCIDCAYTFLIWVQSRDSVIPYTNVIYSVATISCPMSFDFVLSSFFAREVFLNCCGVVISTPASWRELSFECYETYSVCLCLACRSECIVTHSSMCGSYRLKPLSVVCMTLLALGFGLGVTAAELGTFPKQLIAYIEHRQSRVLNVVGILVSVLVGAVVDASAFTFTAQTVIVLFTSLNVIFNARFTLPFSAWTSHALLSACRAADHEGRILVDWVWKYHQGETIRTKAYASFCFVLRGCPHDYRHFEVEGCSIHQKVKGYVLDMDADCSMDHVFFMELFVGLVQTLIDSLFRVTKFPRLSCACTWKLLCFLSWHPKCDG